MKLIIEIDGCTHDFKIEEDEKRQRELEKMGLSVIRFGDKDVKTNLDGVIKYIKI